MGKRINALQTSSTINGNYRIAVDVPGWPEAQYRTLTSLQTFFTGHAAVTINNTNGLTLSGQLLGLNIFGSLHGGACPAEPIPEIEGVALGDYVLTGAGTWLLLNTPGDPIDGINVMQPVNPLGYVGVGDEGKFAFNVSEVNPLGTANWYSNEAGIIKTADKVEITGGVKLGSGIEILSIAAPTTGATVATGDYVQITIKVSGTEQTILLPTYELDV